MGFAPWNLDLLETAVRSDLRHCSTAEGIEVRPRLGISCVDQAPEVVPVMRGGALLDMPLVQALQLAAALAGDRDALISRGPTRSPLCSLDGPENTSSMVKRSTRGFALSGPTYWIAQVGLFICISRKVNASASSGCTSAHFRPPLAPRNWMMAPSGSRRPSRKGSRCHPAETSPDFHIYRISSLHATPGRKHFGRGPAIGQQQRQ